MGKLHSSGDRSARNLVLTRQTCGDNDNDNHGMFDISDDDGEHHCLDDSADVSHDDDHVHDHDNDDDGDDQIIFTSQNGD